MFIVLHECPSGGSIGQLGGQQNNRSVMGGTLSVAFNGIGVLDQGSGRDKAYIHVNPFGIHKTSRVSITLRKRAVHRIRTTA